MIKLVLNFMGMQFSKRIIFLTIICLSLILGCAVHQDKVEKDSQSIVLPMKLRDKTMEFSGMAWHKDRLLLVPQYPDTFNNEMYALSRAAIDDAVVNGKEISAAQILKVQNLQAVKRKIGTSYGGFEAAVVIDNRIFFTIETKTADPNCYLIGGTINENNIILNDKKLIPLPKLKRLSNAGYESLGYLKDRDKLLILFEYNKADVGSKALLIDTALNLPMDQLHFDPLMYRITDITAIGPNRFLGINYHFNASKTEFPEYIGADSLFREPAMQGRTLGGSSFTRIVELNVTDKITWKAGRTINFEMENWEGIAPYKNGVLIVTDTFPTSMLKWYKTY